MLQLAICLLYRTIDCDQPLIYITSEGKFLYFFINMKKKMLVVILLFLSFLPFCWVFFCLFYVFSLGFFFFFSFTFSGVFVYFNFSFIFNFLCLSNGKMTVCTQKYFNVIDMCFNAWKENKAKHSVRVFFFFYLFIYLFQLNVWILLKSPQSLSVAR